MFFLRERLCIRRCEENCKLINLLSSNIARRNHDRVCLFVFYLEIKVHRNNERKEIQFDKQKKNELNTMCWKSESNAFVFTAFFHNFHLPIGKLINLMRFPNFTIQAKKKYTKSKYFESLVFRESEKKTHLETEDEMYFFHISLPTPLSLSKFDHNTKSVQKEDLLCYIETKQQKNPALTKPNGVQSIILFESIEQAFGKKMSLAFHSCIREHLFFLNRGVGDQTNRFESGFR